LAYYATGGLDGRRQPFGKQVTVPVTPKNEWALAKAMILLAGRGMFGLFELLVEFVRKGRKPSLTYQRRQALANPFRLTPLAPVRSDAGAATKCTAFLASRIRITSGHASFDASINAFFRTMCLGLICQPKTGQRHSGQTYTEPLKRLPPCD